MEASEKRIRLSEDEHNVISRAREFGHDLDIEKVVELAERIKDVSNEQREQLGPKTLTIFEKRDLYHFCEAIHHLAYVKNPEYGRLIPSDVLKAIQREKVNTVSIDRIIEVGMGKPESQPEIDRLEKFGKRVWSLCKDSRALLEKFTDAILVDGNPLTGPIGLGCETLDILESILDLAGDNPSCEQVAAQIGAWMRENRPS